MARLQFCDYHNMVAILKKGEFNLDFHPMVDFIAASPLRYAFTVKPTIFVSHIRQFWSAARIETTDEGTHIFATVDGIQRTVSESSLRRNLKLRDDDCIVSIPDTELFENLTLMGYPCFTCSAVFVITYIPAVFLSMSYTAVFARGCLHVSEDSITGKSQREKDFWRRIYEYYESKNTSEITRTVAKVKGHWHYMNPLVEETVRPTGTKKAKKDRKGKSTASTSSSKSRLDEIFEKHVEDNKKAIDQHHMLKEKKIKVEVEKLKVKAIKAKNKEIAILFKDPSKMKDFAREVWKKRAMKIKENRHLMSSDVCGWSCNKRHANSFELIGSTRVPGKIAVFSIDNALRKLERANDLQFLLSPDNNEELIYMYFKPYAIYLDDCLIGIIVSVDKWLVAQSTDSPV
uniref:Glutathione S-transferase T3-like n=1 Tax=Tanacetum cinerariifolium TaxID=118510 RepID=A0A6L2NTU8_TANCI|nr:glutathione S-transferase T3-like [Tanacetum cinerariifolium]